MEELKMAYPSSMFQSIGMATATAIMVGMTVPFLQSDLASRHLLSQEQLHQKRQKEYEYRWSSLVEKLFLTSLHQLGADTIRLQDQEIQDFIQNKCLVKGGRPKIVAIGVDQRLKTKDICLWIRIPSDDDGLVYQANMKEFGLKLHAIMESRLTSTTMCFITEATGGLGTNVIASVLQNSDLQVPVIREPQWMVMFAKLVDEGLISRDTLERCLFGFVRLDASSVQGQAKTVCFTLPGQGVSAVMMPILQAAFPCERHVFIYDGCRSVVGRTLVNRKKSGETSPLKDKYQCLSTTTHTTPMTQHLRKQIRNISEALAKLPLNLADTTEAWMTSVDSFLKLKEEENTNEYLPFVCKLGFLLGSGGDQELAVQNLLQFITGARSRPLPDGAIPKAIGVLNSMAFAKSPGFSPSLHKAIEDCVFRHKAILIGDKTLLDTVLPKKDWSLKAAKKISGCSCCGPEDEDEDEFNPSTGLETMVNGVDMSKPGGFTQMFDQNKSNGEPTNEKKKATAAYVDGKAMFAFDPTRFG